MFFYKKEEWTDESPIGICCSSEADFTAEEDGKKVKIRTGQIILEADCTGGTFCWRDAADEHVLLREGRKELTEAPYMVYNTGDEAPVIHRVQTVDGERNFVKNLRAVEDHKAYHGKLCFLWEPDEHIHGLGQEKKAFMITGEMCSTSISII